MCHEIQEIHLAHAVNCLNERLVLYTKFEYKFSNFYFWWLQKNPIFLIQYEMRRQ